MNIKTKTMLVGMLLSLLSLAFSIGVATSYAAEVGYVKNGDTEDGFKLYEVGENLFLTDLPHEILSTFYRDMNYQAGYKLDNGGQYYPLTDYSQHLASWKYTQRYSNGVLKPAEWYVYIEEFNPDFPGNTDPNQPDGTRWHNNVYLYAGDLPAGRYMLRNSYTNPAGTDPSGVLIPDDPTAFKLLVAVYDRDPETGDVIWTGSTLYGYPTNAIFDVEEGQYVVIYYTFFDWEFEWYRSLNTSLYFSYMPQLYPLTEITPSDLANSGQSFEELIAQLKWESYEDGYGSGYKVGYDEGWLAGLDWGYQRGYKVGYDDGEDKGYSSGYDTGSKDGFYVGYSKGNEVGYDQGYNVGYKDGQDEAYPRGYDVGNEEGYKRGVKELDTAGGVVGSFLSTTWDIVVDAIKIVSEGTTINGISISGIIFTAIGVFILGFIVKKITR